MIRETTPANKRQTTTPAMLNQVTFQHLIALHDKLVKNDDAQASRGFNLVLTTRRNCVLRLGELIAGANSGRGLSAFHSASTSLHSSVASSRDGSPSQDVSPPEGLEEESDEHMGAFHVNSAFTEDDNDASDAGVDEPEVTMDGVSHSELAPANAAHTHT